MHHVIINVLGLFVGWMWFSLVDWVTGAIDPADLENEVEEWLQG